jgi:16S rRNA (guanine527-N7)-methyltransferase
MDKEILLLQQNARELGIDLNTLQLNQFDIYQKELLTWNSKTNLISEKSAHEIINRHFLDSLTALQFIGKQKARMIDIGCGAGFPGLPLKIAAPDLQLYLLESNRKKISFLKNIVRLLNLSDTIILHDRSENLMKDSERNNYFDIVISRAAFKLPELLPQGAYFLAPQGKLIALKGGDVAAEFSLCKQDSAISNFSECNQYDVNYSFRDSPRKIIVWKKKK